MSRLENLPRVQVRDGLQLVGSEWEYGDRDKAEIYCTLRIADAEEPNYRVRPMRDMPFGWKLAISKTRPSGGRLGRAWEAYVTFGNWHRGASVVHGAWNKGMCITDKTISAVIARGHDRGWETPIRELRMHGALIVQALRRIGAALYTPQNFRPLRPFKVKYPWCDPEEPNAKYSPFTYCAETFDTESDGTVLMFLCPPEQAAKRHSWDPLPWSMKGLIEAEFGANAYLMDPDENGMCELFHRDSMQVSDPIHIDDWRARIVAGS